MAGGSVDCDQLLHILKESWDIIVAVDGGMNPFWVIGKQPDILLGDFDSCDERALHYFREQGVDEVAFNPEKDDTDAGLAIEMMIERGVDEGVILGATGTRMDHTVANMMLLSKYAEAIDLTIVNRTNRLFMAKKNMRIQKDGYNYLSLLPLTTIVSCVDLSGVAYQLQEASLYRESSYAISNEILDEECHLSFSDGKLLVIQSND